MHVMIGVIILGLVYVAFLCEPPDPPDPMDGQ